MFSQAMLDGPYVTVPLPIGSVFEAISMLECSGRDQVAKQASTFGWSNFEPPMPELFYLCVKKAKGLVLDIGANTGFYSILAAAARPDLKILAFEPDPTVRPILEGNLKMNGLGDRVSLFSTALSDRIGKADLFIPSQEHGLVETSSSLERTFKKTHSAVVQVEVDTLDNIFSGQRNCLRRISLLKIDVEGHESSVLRGAAAIIKRHRPVIFIEVLPEADFTFLNAFVKANAYKDIRLTSAGVTAPFDEVELFEPLSWNHVFAPAEKLPLL
jgi:FkbM family methyltransferase